MNHLIDNSTGVILAGGENRRMPVPKAFIKVEGRPIINRTLRIMKRLFQEVFIVTNQPELYIHLDAVLLGDVYDTRGPMTGIFTALINASNDWVFVTACDMPFVDEGIIRHMASKRKGALVAVLPLGEPLHAFYSKGLLSSIERAILTGRKALEDFLEDKKVKYISKDELSLIGDIERAFVNLNTPEDLESIEV